MHTLGSRRVHIETFWVDGGTRGSRSDHRKTLQLGAELQHALLAAAARQVPTFQTRLDPGSPLDHGHTGKKYYTSGLSLKSNSPNIPDCGAERRAMGVALHDAARLLSRMSQQLLAVVSSSRFLFLFYNSRSLDVCTYVPEEKVEGR